MTLLDPTDTSTAPAGATTDPAAPHEHAWQTRSTHRTSSGIVRYVSCVSCGGNRVDLQHHADEPPTAVSRVIGAHTPPS